MKLKRRNWAAQALISHRGGAHVESRAHQRNQGKRFIRKALGELEVRDESQQQKSRSG